MAYPEDMKDKLDDAGFWISNDHVIPIPLRRDPVLKQDPWDWEKRLVEFFVIALCTGSREDLSRATLEGLSMNFLTRGTGRSTEQARSLCADVQRVLWEGGLAKDLPVYYNLSVAHLLCLRLHYLRLAGTSYQRESP